MHKAGWINVPGLNEAHAGKVEASFSWTDVGARRKEEFRNLLRELDEAEGKICRGENNLFFQPDAADGKINPNEMACVCLLARSYNTAHKYPEMPRAVKILDEAGWIRVGESTYSESTHEANVAVTPTPAGHEKFKSLLSLLSELDNAEHKLSPDEAAFAWALARIFAQDKGHAEKPRI